MKSTPVSRAAALSSSLLVSAGLLTGCGDDTGGTASEDSRTVAAAFYPLQFVAERVAGPHLTVENLTAPGGEPHDLELTVRETAQISQATLVVYERGFQPAVDDSVDENAEGAVIDAAEVVDLLPFEEHEGEEHGHGETDPHFWQDPIRLADLSDAVAEELAEIDPDNADDYSANAAGLRTDLEALDQEYVDGLASCERTLTVVNHDAFGYLGEYGLEIEPILGLSPDAEPTPADLATLQELVRDEGITTVFSETLVSPETAESLAGDLGIEAAVLDPIEGLADTTAEDDYLSLMRSNLTVLQRANGC